MARFSWKLYLFIVPVAALSGLIGVVFHKGALIWRDHIENYRRIPLASKPAIGALVNRICDIMVFLAIALIGVFGLGYSDLRDYVAGRITGIPAVTLAVAKLATTTAVYAWGRSGRHFFTDLILRRRCGFGIEPALLVSHPFAAE
jgi:H+/Cl- antiporter ClcA